jgi:hypothetical protein
MVAIQRRFPVAGDLNKVEDLGFVAGGGGGGVGDVPDLVVVGKAGDRGRSEESGSC